MRIRSLLLGIYALTILQAQPQEAERANQPLQTFAIDGLASYVAFTANGDAFITASNNKTPQLWSVTDGSLIHSFGGVSRDTVALSEDRQLFLTSSLKKVYLWSVMDGALLHTFEIPFNSWTVAFSPDGQSLLISDMFGSKLFSTADYSLLQTFEFKGSLAIF